MILLRLALLSLKNRRLSAGLTIFSIALSTALLFAVERSRRAAEDGFTQSISQTDLIVGARTGPINLILYTIFNMGNASNNIDIKSYETFKRHPAVAWTIPYSLGDGHRGFRVVATNEDFYRHYRFRGQRQIELDQGSPAINLWQVAVGAEVANRLQYKLGDAIVLTHGVTRGDGIQKHDDKPFTISGILRPTGTGIDQSLYISLESMEAIHLDWKSGVAPTDSTAIPAADIKLDDLKVEQITAFFLRTHSRIQTLQLQREINTFKDEPLLAVIPGVALAELWQGLSQIDRVLKIIAALVVIVGLASMLSAILTSLNERRREMSILRSLGAKPSQIAGLLLLESCTLTLAGLISGVVVEVLFFSILAGWLERQFGLYVVGPVFTSTEWIYAVIIFSTGVFTGLIPAIQAARQSLKDGLAVRI